METLSDMLRRRGIIGLVGRAATKPLEMSGLARLLMDFEGTGDAVIQRTREAHRRATRDHFLCAVRTPDCDRVLKRIRDLYPSARFHAESQPNLVVVAQPRTDQGQVSVEKAPIRAFWAFYEMEQVLFDCGLHVSRQYRGSGLAGALLHEALQELGGQALVKTLTDPFNRAARRTMRKHGLEPIRVRVQVRLPSGRYVFWSFP